MTNAEKRRKYCVGCRNDFYNGNNNLGVKECCMLKNAKIVFKKCVPIDQRPPWNQKARRMLSCYHRQGYVYVGADVTC